MDTSRYSQGAYLRAEDLADTTTYSRITGVGEVEIEESPRLVLKTECGKIVLNKTNVRSMQTAYGTDADDWVGRRVKIQKETTNFSGKTVPCIRVYGQQSDDGAREIRPAPKKAAKAPPPDIDADIPF